jgi:hypothetical protein
VATTAEFKEFERNLEFARRLVSSGRQLEQLKVGSFDVADLYRAAWVQAVSALDHWIHREIYARVGQLIGQPVDRLPKKLREFSMPIAHVDAIHRGSAGLKQEVAKLVREKLGWVSYQSPEKIKEGLAHVTDAVLWREVAERMAAERVPAGGPSRRSGRAATGRVAVSGAEGAPATEQVIRDRLRAIATRRNQIVHEADLAENGRRPVRAQEVEGVIRQVEDIAKAILETLEPRDVPAVSGSAYLFTLGYRESACWLLRERRAAFPNSDRAHIDRLVVGDELFLVTTQKCWGDGPDRGPTLVIGSAVIASPVALLAEPPVLAGRRYPRGCELRMTRLAAYRHGADLKSLVPQLDALPKGSDWGRPLRQTVTELTDGDAELLRAELTEFGLDPVAQLASYPGLVPEQRKADAAG